MNDKQILELAAKAINKKIWFDKDGHCRDVIGSCNRWNPLTDDGDRYRLAKKLKFVVDFELNTVQCEINKEPFIFQWGGIISEEKAFVLAAAEIGKAL